MSSPPGEPVFAGLRVLLLGIGLPANDTTRAVLERGGADVRVAEQGAPSPQGVFDVVVTSLKSASRIGRHLPRDCRAAPAVSLAWAHASAVQRERLPFGAYEIAIPDELRPAAAPPPPPQDKRKRPSTLATLAADAAERRRKAELEKEAAAAAAGPSAPTDVPHVTPQAPPQAPAAAPPSPAAQEGPKRARLSFMSHLASSHSRVAGDDDAASDGASSDGEAAPRPRAPGKLDPTFVNTKYACRRPTPLRSPNDALCADLQTLAEAREFNGDEMNSLAYRRAVAAVRAYPRKLTNPAEAKGIIGVGPKIATKIDEFIMAGRITEAALKRNEERFKVMAEFCTVYGVGPGKAREWYNKGYRSVEEVRKREANLSSQQRMGLKYWDDLKLRIPRTEVEELAAAVVDAVKTMEPDILHTVVGGYRRGKPDSGDVDVLLASPTEGAERGLLRALVEELRRRNFIAELLMFTEHTPADSAKEHNGVAKEGFGVDCLDKAYCIVRSPTSGKFRQMDIVVSPIGCYGCAVVGWSGSTMFERSIREYSAREKGLQFQSWGIFDKATGERIDCRDERDVFRILKLNYIPPEMRCA